MTVCLKFEEDSKKSAKKEQDDVPESDKDVGSEENAVAERHDYNYCKKKKDSHMFKHLQEIHRGYWLRT